MALDLKIPNFISLGMSSDGGGWKSLHFKKPLIKKANTFLAVKPAQEVHSSLHPAVCTSVRYPTLIFSCVEQPN